MSHDPTFDLSEALDGIPYVWGRFNVVEPRISHIKDRSLAQKFENSAYVYHDIVLAVDD